ncbi:uncharacterized protein VTP21DRAFT_5801 [Calcarisporiella thermophila]|uniref:uncharacterized protein n=1 Tax=Calcarisporiella thermophila TaxID=911321 RepID=UPI00374458B1
MRELRGHLIDKIAHEHLHLVPTGIPTKSNEWHLTFLTKDELSSLTFASINQLLNTFQSPCAPQSSLDSSPRIVPLGLGGNEKRAFFVVVAWADGNWLRYKLGLPPKEFHITLTVANDHEMKKGINSVVRKNGDPFEISDELALDCLFLYHHQFRLTDNYSSTLRDFSLNAALSLIRQNIASPRGWARLGEWADRDAKPKIAMLAWYRVLKLVENTMEVCAANKASNMANSRENVAKKAMSRLLQCSRKTEWGILMTEMERKDIEKLSIYAHALDALFGNDFAHLLLQPWLPSLTKRITAASSGQGFDLVFSSRERLIMPDRYVLPRFFRWIIPFRLAGMSTPRSSEDVTRLAQLGITTIITLTEEQPLSREWFHTSLGIKNVFFPVKNYKAPSEEQMNDIIALARVEQGATLVHCGGGKGRAGTVLAIFIALFGLQPLPPPSQEPIKPEMDANTAISLIRQMRPGSLETEEQERFVEYFVKRKWKCYNECSKESNIIEEPKGGHYAQQGVWEFVNDPELVMLVGLPGSGKSWVANMLVTRDPTKWIRISQDECGGSRCTVEAALGHASSPSSQRTLHKKVIIIDRCNVTAEDRRHFLSLAFNPKLALCIYFDYSPGLCERRVSTRRNHPTLPPTRAATVVRSFSKQLEAPSLAEGFRAIVTIRSFSQALDIVRKITRCGHGGSMEFFKFPRTSHFLNLGSATRDDLIWSATDVAAKVMTRESGSSTVIIQEKVDGANLGFSMDLLHGSLSHFAWTSSMYGIRVQNRNHEIVASSHPQFKHLSIWLDCNGPTLLSILAGKTLPPADDEASHWRYSEYVDSDTEEVLFPDRYILFGEWLSATHSIMYDNLPDRFLAFDLYDRHSRRFVSHVRLEAALRDSGIMLVPVIYEGPMPRAEELKGIVARRKSEFIEDNMSDGAVAKDVRLEGIILRWEDGGWLKERAKIVREDFITGDEHWSRRNIRWNGVRRKMEQ